MQDLKLPTAHAQSDCWAFIRKHYELQLAEWRQRLENPTLEESARVALCWKIDTIKKLLAADSQT